MDICFILVEDKSVTIDDVKSLLRAAGISDMLMWPSSSAKTAKTWEDAFKLITHAKVSGFDPNQKCTVLLTDLVLNDKSSNAAQGVQEILSHEWTRDYVRIAVTRFPSAAADQMDGEYDANRLGDRSSSLTEKAQHLMRVVKSAVEKWSKRLNRPAPQFPARPWVVEDSVGARQAQAALDDALPALVEKYLTRWTQIRVRCLSGGYSGAFVLHISGIENGSASQIVCKVSKRKSLLDEEAMKLSRVTERYHAFHGMVPPTLGVQPLASTPAAWYIQYAAVAGDTLEKALLSAGNSRLTALPHDIQSVFVRLEAVGSAIVAGGVKEEQAENLLVLFREDVDRFEGSLSQLASFRDQCVSRHHLEAAEWHSVDSMNRFREAVVKKWTASIRQAGLFTVPACDQHGDLNPRNIIVSANMMQLIDWARWGSWPVGYDLVRLELQLLLRLTDANMMADHFADNMGSWLQLWNSLRADNPSPSVGVDARLSLCLDACRNLSNTRNRLFTEIGTRQNWPEWRKMTGVIRTYDAIKMASYADSSWPKRLWFLLIAMQSAQDAGLEW